MTMVIIAVTVIVSLTVFLSSDGPRWRSSGWTSGRRGRRVLAAVDGDPGPR